MAQMVLHGAFLGDVLNVNVLSRLGKAGNSKRAMQVRAVATKEARVGVLTPLEREVARKRSMRVGDMAEEMKRVRAQMEDDEQLSSLMRGLRGQNLSDSEFATSDTQMRLIEIDGGNGGGESLPLVYDPVTIASYWGKKPAAVATRIAQLLGVAGGFLSGIAMDVITKKIKENEVKRAIELREIVTSLGPAYIKLGQALSIRPDVLSPSAMTELQKLCDKVPSFPNDIAMALLEEELGKPWTEIYSELSPSPIAAASLGQVYKGRLIENGHVVAVKVQRPYVLETVTIDLFIIRKLGVALRRFPQVFQRRGSSCTFSEMNLDNFQWDLLFGHTAISFESSFSKFLWITSKGSCRRGPSNLPIFTYEMKVLQIATDVVGLIDEWASRFFEELDYIHEGENATRFAASMAVDLPQVVVPKTYTKYTSRRVLTSEWIEGEKLSISKASDVGDLVNIGVICYLKQLLDTGLFHADPHPGNLIRTPDGKLAILDFGLMTQITDTQKYGMIEAISHLIHRDYEAIVEDFVALDFIPDGVNLKPIMPVLAKVFDQALEGGGAKNINFQELAADLAQITFDYPFRIPPYFALIIRAIGVLEGIALVGNPEFAIVDEAYPYIAQRLLTDQNPRLREALRYTIYGKSGVFDADRFIDVMEAFETFTAAARTGGGSELQGNMASLGSASSLTSSNTLWIQQAPSQNLLKPSPQPGHTRTALLFIFSEQGGFFREFILDEVVKGIDAVSREQLARVMVVFGIDRLRPVLIQSVLPLLPGLRPLTYVPTVTPEDETVLNNVNRVMEFLTVGTAAERSISQRDRNLRIYDVVQELLPVLPNVASQLLPEIVNRLVSRMVARTLREIALTLY